LKQVHPDRKMPALAKLTNLLGSLNHAIRETANAHVLEN
jgi:hypothetical protein